LIDDLINYFFLHFAGWQMVTVRGNYYEGINMGLSAICSLIILPEKINFSAFPARMKIEIIIPDNKINRNDIRIVTVSQSNPAYCGFFHDCGNLTAISDFFIGAAHFPPLSV
jgi:hypothetical protein